MKTSYFLLPSDLPIVIVAKKFDFLDPVRRAARISLIVLS